MNLLANVNIRPIEFVLRIGVFGTFVGHGIFALMQKSTWIPFLTYWGITQHRALQLMICIGIIDIIIGIISLIRPIPLLLIYATAWAFIAALMRPLTGEPFLEFVERSANWAVPLALYFYISASAKKGIS